MIGFANRRPRPVAIGAIADTHCGSSMGLMHPDGIDTGKDGISLPSRHQRWAYARFLELVDELKRAAVGRRCHILLVGDLIDGVHHSAVELVTHNVTMQKRMCREALAPLIALADRLYVIRGTEAHAGPDCEDEEDLAEWWGADRLAEGDGRGAAVRCPESGTWTWPVFHGRIGGLLFNVAHATTASSLPWAQGNAAVRLSNVIMARYAQRRAEIPDVVLRAHVHLCHDSGINNKRTRATILPAWQLCTEYARGRDLQMSDVGGLIIQATGGVIESYRPVLYPPEPDQVWSDDEDYITETPDSAPRTTKAKPNPPTRRGGFATHRK